jgi:Tfp pilus assembly protein PilV
VLFREANAVNCKNHMKHTNTTCGQNAEFLYIKADGTYRTTELERANVECHESMINQYEHIENG